MLGGCTSDEPVSPRAGPAVVIGSGFGGSVSALRLAEAGVETIVLERGKRWDIRADGDTFPRFGEFDGRSAWLTETLDLPVLPEPIQVERFVGLLEILDSIERSVCVIAAAGLGGGSLVYGGTLVQPTERAFYASLPRSVDYEAMDTIYYPRARSMLGASVIPADILEHENYRWTRAAIAEVDGSSLLRSPAPAGFDWDVARAELRGDIPAALTIGEYAISGCNSGATNSTGRNYLRQAEHTGLVDVRVLHQVRHLERREGGGYRLFVDRIDESGTVVEELQIHAGVVFLAAGSMGTTRLLLRSRARGGLGVVEALGLHWATNGDSLALRQNIGVTAGPQGGPPILMASREDDDGILGLEYANAGGDLVATLGMAVLDDFGEVAYDEANDDIVYSWPQAAQDRVEAAVGQLHAALDASNPGSSRVSFGRANTYHPLGGAVMERVCDTYGRVFGNPGLYVVDGALIPGYTGARNPALTITALAERALEDIVEKDFG